MRIAGRTLTCDAATWRAYANVSMHGRLAATGRVVNAVELDRDDVLLASVVDGIVVARWSPTTALGAVTTAEALLSPARGAPGDRAIRVRAGAPVTDTAGGELAVHARGRITVDGFVPARVRGRVWTAPEPLTWTLSHGDYIVRAAPDASAPIRARLHDAFVKVRGGTAAWFEVTATDGIVEVDGFVARPPPSRAEVDDAAEEDAPETQIAVGTCLYDAPDGHPAGAVVGYVAQPPRPAASAGWQALRVDTAWGARDYFFPTPPPVEDDSAPTWPWPSADETW